MKKLLSLRDTFEELGIKIAQDQEELSRLKRENLILKRGSESSHIGMCLVSPNGKFLEVNSICCEIWERTEEELLGLTFQEITKEEHIPVDQDKLDEVLSGRRTHYNIAKMYIMPNGSYKPCWIDVSSIPREDGCVVLLFSKIMALSSIDQIRDMLLDLVDKEEKYEQ